MIIIFDENHQGMGCTWEKFSSLLAINPQKFETATRKENFKKEKEGCTSGRKIVSSQIQKHDIDQDLYRRSMH